MDLTSYAEWAVRLVNDPRPPARAAAAARRAGGGLRRPPPATRKPSSAGSTRCSSAIRYARSCRATTGRAGTCTWRSADAPRAAAGAVMGLAAVVAELGADRLGRCQDRAVPASLPRHLLQPLPALLLGPLRQQGQRRRLPGAQRRSRSASSAARPGPTELGHRAEVPAVAAAAARAGCRSPATSRPSPCQAARLTISRPGSPGSRATTRSPGRTAAPRRTRSQSPAHQRGTHRIPLDTHSHGLDPLLRRRLDHE